MSIQLKDYDAAIFEKGGIGTEDILDGAITANKVANDLKRFSYYQLTRVWQ